MSNVPEHLEAELERQSQEEIEVDELGDEPFAESADENYDN